MWPLIAANRVEMFPLPVALALLRGAYSSESYGPIMAGAALSAVPLLVVFLVANRRIVEGVRLSGVRGRVGPCSREEGDRDSKSPGSRPEACVV